MEFHCPTQILYLHLISSFIMYILFVVGGILYFTKQDGLENEESKIISQGTSMIAACLIGWLAGLVDY